MSRPIDLARHLLALADRDIRAFRKLVDDAEIDEATVGFLVRLATSFARNSERLQ
jgi:hypothetical protein